MSTAMSASFETIGLDNLETMTLDSIDALPFGVVGLDAEGIVLIYSATEARLAGLDPDKVIGASYFDDVAQCMNNFMVAQRFEDETRLDEIIPYVLTLRMRPTRVRLRMLKAGGARRNYILIER